MNEFGFENLSADKTPLVVLVSSSTGDGDPPDNAAKFYMALRRRSNEDSMLQASGVMPLHYQTYAANIVRC